MATERLSDIPKYERVRRQLLQDIESGRHSPGAPFPSERELLQQFEVSRPTLVRSLQELVRDGYLVRQRGKGTFVAPRRNGGGGEAVDEGFVVFLSREVAGFTGAGREVQLRILRGIQSALGDAYDVTSVRHAGSGQVDPQTREFIESRKPRAALVIEPSFCPGLLHLLAEHGCVVWAVNEPSEQYNAVRIDQEHAGYLATRHLVEQGRKQIALLNGPEDAYWGFAARRQGYERALCEAKLDVSAALVLQDGHPVDSEAGRAMMRRLLTAGVVFDGVVGASDSKSIGALAAAREAGLDVPAQVAFVSIDNTLAHQADPPLAAVAMPFEEMGFQAALQARTAAQAQRPRRNVSQIEVVLRPRLIER